MHIKELAPSSLRGAVMVNSGNSCLALEVFTMRKLSVRKFGVALASLVLPALSFAQEQQGSNWDFSALVTEANNMKTAYTGFMTGTMLGVAAAVVAAGVVIWLVLRIPRNAGLGTKK